MSICPCLAYPSCSTPPSGPVSAGDPEGNIKTGAPSDPLVSRSPSALVNRRVPILPLDPLGQTMYYPYPMRLSRRSFLSGRCSPTGIARVGCRLQPVIFTCLSREPPIDTAIPPGRPPRESGPRLDALPLPLYPGLYPPGSSLGDLPPNIPS